MKRAGLLLLLCLACGLVACGMSAQALPQPTPADPTARVQAATATAQAHEAAALANALARITVEAFEAQQAQLTREALDRQAQATAAMATATQQAVAHTLAAEATLTERAWMQTGWTATAASAQATSTSEALRAVSTAVASEQAARLSVLTTQTQAAMYLQGTAEAAQVMAQATIQAAYASEAQQAAERTRLTNATAAWMQTVAWPVGLLFGGVIVLLLAFWLTRLRIVRPDERGVMPIIVTDGRIITLPERSVYAQMDARHPATPPIEAQARITENSQRVEAIRAMPAARSEGPRRSLQSWPGQPSANPAQLPPTAPPVQIEVISPSEQPVVRWLEEVENQLPLNGGSR